MTRPTFRRAKSSDVPAIVAMLREDALGAERETATPAHYAQAFARLADAPQHQLIVGEIDGRVVAYYQLSLLDGLSHRAARRGNVEDVRVLEDLRGQGLGKQMMDDAAARARTLGCDLLQLVAHNTRQASHAFYISGGFTASHVGFKRALSDPEEQQ